ncbi:MAG: hypothetical protein N2376_00460 [Clostridia bacterium]|nr:hypothetical protein [Clostridia bacterium]
MSEVKYCPSCGTVLSLSAVFCHSCGHKQKVVSKEEAIQQAETKETGSELKTENTMESHESHIDKAVVSLVNPVGTVKQDDRPVQASTQEQKPASEAAPSVHINMPSESHNPSTQQDPVSQTAAQTAQKPVLAPQATVQPYHTAPMAPVSATQHTSSMAQAPVQPTQQPYCGPNGIPVAQTAPQAAAKKKFPWFFFALWFILFIGVGIWAYYFFIDAGYDYPKFTEDAQRIVLFTVAVGMLIYTLSLKLSVKKLKALPLVILIVGSLIIFYLFCMVEMMDGDPLHDFFSGITSSILPTSGE